jgi:quinol monooxygenase YgiN
MSYTVLAWWRAEPGDEVEIERLLAELAPLSRAERGCRSFLVHRNPDDPADFLLYEVYDDETAYRAHHASGHFQRLAADRAFPRLAERRHQVYELVSHVAEVDVVRPDAS